MNKVMYLLEKTNFKEANVNLIEYYVEDAVILLNPTTATWTTISKRDADVYLQVKKGDLPDSETTQKLILKLLVNNIIQFKNNIYKPVPVKSKINVYFAPTQYCNLRCVYCYAEAQQPISSMDISCDTKQLFKLLDNIICEGVETVYFTGGEPSLRKDLFELVTYAKNKGVKVGILTNGTHVTEDTVSQYKIFDNVTISLDASQQSINDITRGKGTFNKIVWAIKLLRNHNINVKVSSVISKVNFENIYELLRFVREELDVSSHKVMLYTAKGRGKDNTDTMACSYDEVMSFRSQYIDYLITEKKENEVISLLQPSMQQGNIRKVCGVASTEVFVNHSGEVFPCRLFEDPKYSLGNIMEQSLINVIKNKATRCFQSQLSVDNISGCQGCEVKNICAGGCRGIHSCYTGDISISDPTLCKIIKNDIKNTILLSSGYNPNTLKKI